MSWEAIRGLSKYSKLELWDSERTAKPIMLNNITNAAEEAVSLLKEHDRAVELLRQLRGIIHHELDPAKDSGYYVYDPEGIVEIEIDPFLRKLSGSTELRRDMEGE